MLLVSTGVFCGYFALALHATVPGNNDGLVYYHVAKSMLAGDGITIPYIWNYLSDPEALRGPAFSYWMPLASFLAAGSMAVFGQHVWAALLPFAMLVAVLAGIAYVVTRRMTDTSWAPIAASLVVALHPAIVLYGTTCQGVLPAAVSGAGSFLIVSGLSKLTPGAARTRRLLLAGALAGIAALSRGDGLLVLAVAFSGAVAIDWSQRGWRTSALTGLLVLIGYFAVMAPWYARNISVFDTPLPPGAGKVLFVTEYEDIYSYSKPLTAAAYREHLSSDPLGAASERAQRIWNACSNGFMQLGLLLPLVLLALPAARRSGNAAVIWLALVHVSICIVFYGAVMSQLGDSALKKASMVSLPILAAAAAVGVASLESRRRQLLVGALGLLILLAVAQRTFSVAIGRHSQYTWISEVAAREGNAARAVVMARKPWQVHESTGLPSLQIPYDDVDTIYEVAKRFGANYLHLRYAEERESLQSIYTGETLDDRFVLVEIRGENKLYRIMP